MDISRLRIAKSGKLIAKIYDNNDEQHKDVDVTDQFFLYFDRQCDLGEGLTLKDIFLLIQNADAYSVLSPMLTHGPDWLQEIVDEGLNGKDDEKSNMTLEVYWHAIVDDDIYSDNDDFHIDGQIHGIDDSDEGPFAIGYSSACSLIDCPVVLNTSVSVFDERSESVKKRTEYLDSLSDKDREAEGCLYETVLETNKSFTLYDILYAIFYEMSFHGGPSDRDNACQGLMETLKRIENGEEELMSFEDVEALMGDLNGGSDGEGQEK